MILKNNHKKVSHRYSAHFKTKSERAQIANFAIYFFSSQVIL